MKSINDLKIQLFADGANKDDMLEMYKNKYISGFTTNPTLLRKAGVKDYTEFALDILKSISDRPISFEVFADDFETMEEQALKIRSWGENIYVKIPVMNTKKEYSYDLIKRLANQGVKLNVTAIMPIDQVERVSEAMRNADHGVISVFAGRIADTGVDPVPHMSQSLDIIKNKNKNLQLLWASPRELLNIMQADEIGCDIITATPDILKKLTSLGKNLEEFSLDTVKMFFDDAQSVEYSI